MARRRWRTAKVATSEQGGCQHGQTHRVVHAIETGNREQRPDRGLESWWVSAMQDAVGSNRRRQQDRRHHRPACPGAVWTHKGCQYTQEDDRKEADVELLGRAQESVDGQARESIGRGHGGCRLKLGREMPQVGGDDQKGQQQPSRWPQDEGDDARHQSGVQVSETLHANPQTSLQSLPCAQCRESKQSRPHRGSQGVSHGVFVEHDRRRGDQRPRQRMQRPEPDGASQHHGSRHVEEVVTTIIRFSPEETRRAAILRRAMHRRDWGMVHRSVSPQGQRSAVAASSGC